jgi:outer membrane protein assembly factor BamB
MPALAILALLLPLQEPAAAPAADTNWPSFRGKQACGVAEGFPTAERWDMAKSENIRWRVEVPGLAHSSPVVWGDRIFLTTAVKEGEAELKVGLYGSVQPVKDEGEHELRVLCFDAATGKQLWQKTVFKGVPAIKRHPKGSHAASTPAVDGERVVAFFGTEGLFCFDHDGKRLWQRDLGRLDAGWYMMDKPEWGFGSSPVLWQGHVYVQCDVQASVGAEGQQTSNSFVACLDAKNGEDVWRTPRDEVPGWGTPTVHVGKERSQLLVNGYKHMGGYDLATGQELWKIARGGDIPVPTPIVAHDLVFLTSAHGRLAPILAIALSATGALEMNAEEDEHVVWLVPKGGNYMQTPLAYGDELYCCRDDGSLSCFDAKTGSLHYKQRLGTGRTGFTASPVAANGRLYFTSEEGTVFVVKTGKTFELIGTSNLGEECMASPAISRGTIYFRTRRHLVAVAP